MDKWRDAGFLDRLRTIGDPLADAVVARLEAEHSIQEVNKLFGTMLANAEPVDGPEALTTFLAETSTLPGNLDFDRLRRGGRVFNAHAIPATLVLLASSLPSGYSAPPLSLILDFTRNLEVHPFKRLMGVTQLLVNISLANGFGPRGEALVTAQKMRLLHAGIRRILRDWPPDGDAAKQRVWSYADYRSRYGVPVNHEDQLGTIMGFSLLVIEGLRTLGLALTEEEAEDFYYLWSVFAQMMGIHPEGQPDSTEFVPQSLAEARVFYSAYSARHYEDDPARNPAGERLSQANLDMMVRLLPWWLRAVGFGFAPRILMFDLLGAKGMARTGIAPVRGHRLIRWILVLGLNVLQRSLDRSPSFLAAGLGSLLFRDLIHVAWDGQVTWLIPDSLKSVEKLA